MCTQVDGLNLTCGNKPCNLHFLEEINTLAMFIGISNYITYNLA